MNGIEFRILTEAKKGIDKSVKVTEEKLSDNTGYDPEVKQLKRDLKYVQTLMGELIDNHNQKQ